MRQQLVENDPVPIEDADIQTNCIEKYRRRALMFGAAAGVGAPASGRQTGYCRNEWGPMSRWVNQTRRRLQLR
jgi:hypothetical protein